MKSTLPEIRSAIDRLDDEIVRLLAAREQLVRRAGAVKTDAAAIRAPDRVAAVIARVRAAAVDAGATPDVVERVYRAMIDAFINLELSGNQLLERPVTEPVARRDAGELLTLQRAAYAAEARLYRDPDLPPLVETPEELTAEIDSGIALKVTLGPRIVGAVRGRIEGDLLHVGRLAVAPDVQGRGIGGGLLADIERAAAPTARCATLFTGHLSTPTLRLYSRLGYTEDRREQLRGGLTLVHLSKQLCPPP